MRSSADFLAACEARRITLLDLPTAYWHGLAADLAEGAAWPPAMSRGDRRRRALPAGAGGGLETPARSAGADLEHLRSDRDDRLLDPLRPRPLPYLGGGAPRGAHRPADRRHPRLRARPPAGAGAGRRARGALPGRRRGDARLPGPPGPHGRSVPPRPLRRRARRPPLPHRRPGALAPLGRVGVPGAHRPPGEGPRLPDRAGGDRGGPGQAPRRAGGRGAGAGGSAGGAAAGRLRHPPLRPGGGDRRAARLPQGSSPRAHGAREPS